MARPPATAAEVDRKSRRLNEARSEMRNRRTLSIMFYTPRNGNAQWRGKLVLQAIRLQDKREMAKHADHAASSIVLLTIVRKPQRLFVPALRFTTRSIEAAAARSKCQF